MSKINLSLREINLLFESLEKLRMYYQDTVTDREIMELIRNIDKQTFGGVITE